MLLLTSQPAQAATCEIVNNNYGTGYNKNTSSPQGIRANIGHYNPTMCTGNDLLYPSAASGWVGLTGPPAEYSIAQIGYGKQNAGACSGGGTCWFWAFGSGGKNIPGSIPPTPEYFGNVPDPNNTSASNAISVSVVPGYGVLAWQLDGAVIHVRAPIWTADNVQVISEVTYRETQTLGGVDPSRHVNFGSVQKMYNGQWYTQSFSPSVMQQQAYGTYAIGAGNGWFGTWDTRYPT